MDSIPDLMGCKTADQRKTRTKLIRRNQNILARARRNPTSLVLHYATRRGGGGGMFLPRNQIPGPFHKSESKLTEVLAPE